MHLNSISRLRKPGLRRAAASLALAAGALAGPPPHPAHAATFVNPIVEAAPRTGSADPSVIRHRGYYYYCRVVDDAAIVVTQARRLQDIGAAEKTVVFRAPERGPYSRQLWAPELQRIGARWYIYFAASDGENTNHRMYVLRSAGDDPRGPYEFMGALKTTPDTWAIDGVALRGAEVLHRCSRWTRCSTFTGRGRDQVLTAARNHVIA